MNGLMYNAFVFNLIPSIHCYYKFKFDLMYFYHQLFIEDCEY